ncbi:MAG: DNA recombination protein RmuC [Dysgonamonadaceae bacterium]|jgi:DNA recombination protein RmuC|nr:DNA recombination protein RmuC [Dysgonamonadaceae bacterium]
MELIIWAIVGLSIGALITYLFLRTRYTKLESEFQFAQKEKSLIENNHAQYLQSLKENTQKEIENLKESFDVERKAMADSQKVMKENFEETKLQMEKQWKEKIELLKAEFQQLAGEVLEKKSGNLQNANKEQIDAILNPLKEKIQSFEKAVKDNQISGAENKASLEKAIEEVMKRAQEIGADAVNLTKALRGNSKTQGDWGEMVLESILEKSGLRKDEEYFVQESTTVEGERVRPDVIVRFPEKRSVVIDSKVSLSAYVNYMECENEKERAGHLKNHIKSIKDHIDELSTRNYSQYVEHSIGYVLMFIPNEASYILAVQNDVSLGSYAYDKRIVLISPTNMMMALQLAYNLWQSEKQSQNVREIVKMGNGLYDKFAIFIENFAKMGAQLNTVQNTYDEVSKQLSEGKGNLVGRIEKMRELGLNPKKQLSGKITNEFEE